MFEAILAPTDGSEGARQAVDRAIALASLFNADLHLLFVVDTDQFAADTPPGAVEDLLRDAETAGEDVLAELEGLAVAAGDRSVRTASRRGVAHEEILAYADDEAVELVVLGSHGEGGYEAARLGRTAAAVARRVDAPILLIWGSWRSGAIQSPCARASAMAL